MIGLIKNGTLVRVPLKDATAQVTALIDFLKIDSSKIKKQTQIGNTVFAVTLVDNYVLITAAQSDDWQTPTQFQIALHPEFLIRHVEKNTNYYMAEELLKLCGDLAVVINGSTFDFVSGAVTLTELDGESKLPLKIDTKMFYVCGTTVKYFDQNDIEALSNLALKLDKDKLSDALTAMTKHICFEVEDSKLFMVATDAHTLNRSYSYNSLVEKAKFLFPTFVLFHNSKIKRHKKQQYTANISVEPLKENEVYNSVVYFTTELGTYKFKMRDGLRFPDWKSVVPTFEDGCKARYAINVDSIKQMFEALDGDVKRKKATYSALPKMAKNTDYAEALKMNDRGLSKFTLEKVNDATATITVNIDDERGNLFFTHKLDVLILDWGVTANECTFGFNIEYFRSVMSHFSDVSDIVVYHKGNKGKSKILTKGYYEKNDDGTFKRKDADGNYTNDGSGEWVWIDTVFEATTETNLATGCAFIFTAALEEKADIVNMADSFSLLMPVMLGSMYY